LIWTLTADFSEHSPINPAEASRATTLASLSE
jgi:hypothetical protein